MLYLLTLECVLHIIGIKAPSLLKTPGSSAPKPRAVQSFLENRIHRYWDYVRRSFFLPYGGKIKKK